MTDIKINDFNPEELRLIRNTLAKLYVKVTGTDSAEIELKKMLPKKLINKSNACSYAGIIF